MNQGFVAPCHSAERGMYKSWSSAYKLAPMPICFKLFLHTTPLACFFTRCSAGINIAINKAIIAITTKSSIKVNASRLNKIVLLFARRFF